jgi:hypothetical protein
LSLIAEIRLKATLCIREIYAGEQTWDDFVTQFEDSPDPLIADIVRLIRFAPESADADTNRAYRAQLERAVLKLESAASAF